jgi:hypothetical protein
MILIIKKSEFQKDKRKGQPPDRFKPQANIVRDHEEAKDCIPQRRIKGDDLYETTGGIR